MAKVTLWHNPRCSKSRQALALLEARDLEIEVVHYLDQPPTAATLLRALELLGIGARKLMRTGESVYRELGLNDASSDEELVAAMVAHPVLIERPVVFVGDRAIVARPPERVLELIEP